MKEYAALGLVAWYQNMIPALLPFMILTNLILKLNLETVILKPVYPLLEFLFRLRREMIFAICIGFLCGFPMGSKVACDLYRQGKITRTEAEYLLAFTNNIGPAYYIGFVCPVFFPDISLRKLLILQYGIPLLYGFLLRHLFYKGEIVYCRHNIRKSNVISISFRKAIYSLDDAINAGLIQIAALGGYMILFNVFVCFPQKLLKNRPLPMLFCHLFLEITGGLSEFNRLLASGQIAISDKLLIVQTALSFNGMCCLFQTVRFFKGTDLSVKKYMLHKGILCSIIILCILMLKN